MTVTAFGPFGAFKKNPSEVLGRLLFGSDLAVIPVTFEAVDAFVDELPASADKLLMLGVAGKSKHLRIERFGSDAIGKLADVSGECRMRETSDRIEGKLFANVDVCTLWTDSRDAGDYLCNYLYYQVTKQHPSVETGFVHVAPFTSIPLPLQAVRLRRLISTI